MHTTVGFVMPRSRPAATPVTARAASGSSYTTYSRYMRSAGFTRLHEPGVTSTSWNDRARLSQLRGYWYGCSSHNRMTPSPGADACRLLTYFGGRSHTTANRRASWSGT